jgi:chorismate synthase
MSANTFGHLFRFTTWGESHGPAIGCVVDGTPPGIALTAEMIQADLDRRKPGQNRFVTQRREDDTVEILSGVYEGQTTGAPISLLIKNTDARPKDYDGIKDAFRPGHADYTYFMKYGQAAQSGGGRASARETASRVAAGAVARAVLRHEFGENVLIRAAVVQIGAVSIDRARWDWDETARNSFFCPDAQVVPLWEKFMDETRKNLSSAGAIVEIVASGVPAGLGAPVAAKLDADVAGAMMGINAVKGVEIGSGFTSVVLPGEKSVDAMRMQDGQPVFLSNHAGGILGGISTGQDITVRVAFKPTSSLPQDIPTITRGGGETMIKTTGRHDPCVGIRGAVVAEAMLATVLADHALRHKAQCLRTTQSRFGAE